MRPCSKIRGYNHQLSNFLLDLIVRLLDSRIFTSMNFSVSFTSVKFRMLLTKIEFHLSNICELFSSIRSMVNENLLRAKKKLSQPCNSNYHQGSRKQASAVSKPPLLCHNTKPVNKVSPFFAFGTKLLKNNLFVFVRGL